MSIPHIDVGLFCIILGAAIGTGISWIVNFPLASGAALGALGGVGLVLLGVPLMAFWTATERPDCRCGKTKGSDLECEFTNPDGVGSAFSPQDPEACGYHYLCVNCHARWNVGHSICYEILSGNRAEPWKRRAWNGKWSEV